MCEAFVLRHSHTTLFLNIPKSLLHPLKPMPVQWGYLHALIHPRISNKILDTDFLCIQFPQHIWREKKRKKKDKVNPFIYFPKAYLVCFPNSLGFFDQISNLKKNINSSILYLLFCFVIKIPP